MRLRECGCCEDQIAERDMAAEALRGKAWVELADATGWSDDACSAACALAVLREHLQEINELAVVR